MSHPGPESAIAAVDPVAPSWPNVPFVVKSGKRARGSEGKGRGMWKGSQAALFDPPFEALTPVRHAVPAVFNSPHSGRQYPAAFLKASRLDPLTLRRSEDCFIDELFSPAVELGAPLLRAHFPRAYLDVNREPYELDPSMFGETLPDFANTGSVRVAGGLGTIPRIVSEHEEIYRRPLAFTEAQARIDALYWPYHDALRDLIERTARRFGVALLLDCHSMPSTAAPMVNGMGLARADIVLGDRYGSTCAPSITACLEDLLLARGLTVVRNKPYSGGFITQSYGRPNDGYHTLQIEVNRGLYADERTIRPTPGFAPLKSALAAVIASFLSMLPDLFAPRAIAAE